MKVLANEGQPSCTLHNAYHIASSLPTRCFICVFFVWAFIYETKGLALEQVDELYAKVGHAWQSPGFVPSVSFQDVQDVKDGRRMSLVEAESMANRKRSVTHVEGNEKENYTTIV